MQAKNMGPLLAGACAALLRSGLSLASAQACTPTSPLGLAACVQKDRYQADLTAIGAKPRPIGSPAAEETRKRCQSAFREAGFEVRRHEIPIPGTTVANVIGYRKGTKPERPAVVLGAHLDSVNNCNGANDNATGVAGVLELARILGKLTFETDLYVACWDAEESNLLGSSAWVHEAKKAGRKLDVGVSLEQIGNRQTAPNSQVPVPQFFAETFPEAAQQINGQQRRGDFVLLVSDPALQVEPWSEMTQAARVRLLRVQLPAPGSVHQVRLSIHLSRSDHAPFWRSGYSGLFVGDTAEFRTSGYHCLDRPDDLQYIDVDFAVGVVRAITVFAAHRLRLAPSRG